MEKEFCERMIFLPKIYLSPSTQEFNKYVTRESEEYFMNLLADYLTPYLYSNGISFKRNKTCMTAKQNIEDSNRGNYDFHLALHSNAAPKGEEGTRQGVEIYYYPESSNGYRMAELLKDNFEDIYPDPDNIRLIPTTSLGEVDKTNAPAVLIEVAYHDNIEDAVWIEENLPVIAKAIGESLAEYFDIPFAEPMAPVFAKVKTRNTNLNLRDLPYLNSKIFTSMPNDSSVVILGQEDDWARLIFKGILGFASDKYLNYD